MLTSEQFAQIIRRANLAPSVHNSQPTRWAQTEFGFRVFCDHRQRLTIGDPDGNDAELSVGAALEASIMAAEDLGFVSDVRYLDSAKRDTQLQAMAEVSLVADPIPSRPHQLEKRFTWRGMFADAGAISDFPARSDVVWIDDKQDMHWLADLNDQVSLDIMRQGPFRRELLDWMRLSPRHPEYGRDGMAFEAMNMSRFEARLAGLALGPLWPVLDRIGATRSMTKEAAATQSAAALAVFHVDAETSQIEAGRAYLRLWLAATEQGWAGWPMAALGDHPDSRREICKRLNLGVDRRLVQVIRFGPSGGTQPPRARRDVRDLIVSL